MKPPVGSHVVDTRSGKVGIVMGHEGPYVQLRPYGGGKEWDAAHPRRAAQRGDRVRQRPQPG